MLEAADSLESGAPDSNKVIKQKFNEMHLMLSLLHPNLYY
jgi:hypothetical protein